MAGIPKQVEEADRLAREWVKGLSGEAEITDEEATEEEEKTEEEESEDPPEEEESESTESEEEETEEEATEETDSDDEEEESWQQRYKTLKGMFEAETKKYNKELGDLKAQVFERLGQLSQPAVQPEETTEPEMPEEVQAFIEEMGPEYMGKLEKYIQHMITPLVESSVKPVADKVEDVEDATFKAAQKQFEEYLDGKVNGDWKALMEGEDDKFIEFLQSPDPSGLYTFGQLMKLYNDNWDADRLSTLLNTYLGEPEEETPPPPKKKAKVPNVQPKRKAPNTTPEAEEEKKIWTQADIRDLEKAERDGKLTEEESKAQFADLLAAAHEGRIRG